MNVNDELCPDIEYGENDGKTAFKCLECKLVFIPMSYMHGDGIVDYELCRRHVGVIKCENCAMPLVGLNRVASQCGSQVITRCSEGSKSILELYFQKDKYRDILRKAG